MPLTTTDPADEQANADVMTHLSGPGSFFTGAERLAIAHQTRVARGLAAEADPVPAPLADHVVAAARRVGADAISTRQSHVDEWVAAGLDILAYVELVSVASLASAIDSYSFAVGRDVTPLPAPLPGEPVPAPHPDARIMNAWVPTVGVALAPTALTALPAETAVKKALGITQYLADKMVHSYAEEPGRELTRPQLELVASRTSWLNECFF